MAFPAPPQGTACAVLTRTGTPRLLPSFPNARKLLGQTQGPQLIAPFGLGSHLMRRDFKLLASRANVVLNEHLWWHVQHFPKAGGRKQWR